METGKNSFERAAGVLLPVSSIPSPYGIGSFGKEARNWVDFLHDAQQSYWQILPLTPTGEGDSPYQSFSAFAGNPYFIDLDTLYEQGLLKREEYADIDWGASDKSVDYTKMYQHREPVLRKAFSRFKDDAALDAFIEGNPWFEYFSLYMVIKETQGLHSWLEWEAPLRNRDQGAINSVRAEAAEEIRFHAFVQYQFDKQWNALRAYANMKDIQIVGDIPIYVSLDSADVWENRLLFQLDENSIPLEVAGCPPDYFSADGQLWGNPLYDWGAMSKSGYEWWISRLKKNFKLFDVLRLDHFRGLESYFAIPYGDTTAKRGYWKPGPGAEFIDMVNKTVQGASIIAEDLGFQTDGVRKLLEYSACPGMKIVQYAFDDSEAGEHLPYKYETNSVVYTGTHDNDTLKGWYKNASRSHVRHAMDYIGIRNKREVPRGMIRLALQSNSSLAIIPMQDWLELDSYARLNTPSTVGKGNWRWRLEKKMLTTKLTDEMTQMTQMYGRNKKEEKM